MVVPEIRPWKRPKRRAASDLCEFLSFPSAAGDGDRDCFAGQPFWSEVQSFLNRYGRLRFPPSLFPSLVTWQILLRVGDHPGAVSLDVVEEDVARSRSIYCDECRVIGWSGHPVCRKRYHFIIRANNTPFEEFHRPCKKCGNITYLSDSRCKSCNTMLDVDDIEDWVYQQLEDTTNLLHGVVHSNGYGHLLIVNGREGGADILSGFDIMNFWDRLCKRLAVRKVSVMDLSKKYGTEYRLLHTVAKGKVWYGNWGYQFGTGSYSLTSLDYESAVHTLSNVPLSTFFFQSRGPPSPLQTLISFYQSLSESQLTTLKDLFSFLLNLISQPNTEKPTLDPTSGYHNNQLCAWMREDVERVEQCMVKVLVTSAMAEKGKWVSLRALKGALYKSASPELINYCLKHLGGRLTGDGMVVRSRCTPTPNPNVVEFRIEPQSCIGNRLDPNSNRPSRGQVINDLRYLYNSILNPETMVTYRPSTTRELVVDSAKKLLDSKQFIKDYKVEQVAAKNPFAISLWCHVELEDNPFPPPELLVLPAHATIADLRSEATKTFKEIYIVFKRFYIQELPDFGHIEGSMTLNLLFGSSGSVRIRGRCNAKYGLSRFRAERGTETWTVDCICGTKDDDGERMLACDRCNVWQHTRCVGIENSDEIPTKFLCKRCTRSCPESVCSIGCNSPREERVESRENEVHNIYGCVIERAESRTLKNKIKTIVPEYGCVVQRVGSGILENEVNATILPAIKTCRDEVKAKGLRLGSRVCMTFDVQ